jgi:lysophospholipase L1-like esterase
MLCKTFLNYASMEPSMFLDGLSYEIFVLMMFIQIVWVHPFVLFKNLNGVGEVEFLPSKSKVWTILTFFIFFGVKFVARSTVSNWTFSSAQLLIALGGLFIVFLLVIIAVLIYKCRRFADTMKESPFHPKYFVPSDRKVIAFLGDSISHGTFGSNWVAKIEEKFNFDVVNAAFNGRTSFDVVSDQLPKVLKCKPDIAVIFCGTNDILSKYLGQMTPIPPNSINYRENLEKVVREFNKIKTKVFIISIPPILEDLSSEPNQDVKEYVKVMEDVAMEMKATYIPLWECLMTVLQNAKIDTGNEENPLLGERRVDMVEDLDCPIPKNSPIWSEFKMNANQNVIHYDLPRQEKWLKLFIFWTFYWDNKIMERSWDEISFNNGLLVTYDGIHLNDVSGTLLVHLLTEPLNKIL